MLLLFWGDWLNGAIVVSLYRTRKNTGKGRASICIQTRKLLK